MSLHIITNYSLAFIYLYFLHRSNVETFHYLKGHIFIRKDNFEFYKLYKYNLGGKPKNYLELSPDQHFQVLLSSNTHEYITVKIENQVIFIFFLIMSNLYSTLFLRFVFIRLKV